jgi:antitoxin CcdA
MASSVSARSGPCDRFNAVQAESGLDGAGLAPRRWRPFTVACPGPGIPLAYARLSCACRSRIMARPANQLKKPTNVTIRADLLEQARELKLNLSQEFETHLAEVIRKRRAEQWLRDNREAIEAYNRFVAKHGIWNEEFRGW